MPTLSLKHSSRTADAVAQWTQKVAQFPQNERAWVHLGNPLMQQIREKYDDHYIARAEQAFHKALRLNAQSAEAMAGLAWVFGARHQFEHSLRWARQAIAIDPNHPEAHGLWGDAMVERGNYGAAFEKYQKMIDLLPDLASCSRGAHLLFLTGDIETAIWLMKKAIAAGGPYPENIAWCRAQLAHMIRHQDARANASGHH
jgi:tetratricopeptide (TPR) repeat protein